VPASNIASRSPEPTQPTSADCAIPGNSKGQGFHMLKHFLNLRACRAGCRRSRNKEAVSKSVAPPARHAASTCRYRVHANVDALQGWLLAAAGLSTARAPLAWYFQAFHTRARWSTQRVAIIASKCIDAHLLTPHLSRGAAAAGHDRVSRGSPSAPLLRVRTTDATGGRPLALWLAVIEGRMLVVGRQARRAS
jgi:hypothetical protein